ncbi:hypothetical protein BHE74_00050614 [Ensete ventricosum]|nr:hypothetical protein BHE74_00050614 [Ensete ventricosum]
MAVDWGGLLMNPGVVSATDYTSVASINIFVALLCACIVIGHLLEEHRWINEAITALVIVPLDYSENLILVHLKLETILIHDIQYDLLLAFCCRHAFATLSFIAEVFLFLYVGMDALDIEKWRSVSNRFVTY